MAQSPHIPALRMNPGSWAEIKDLARPGGPLSLSGPIHSPAWLDCNQWRLIEKRGHKRTEAKTLRQLTGPSTVCQSATIEEVLIIC